MKRLLVAVIALGIFVSVLGTSRASSSQSVAVVHEPELIVEVEEPAQVSAKAYCVIDVETGEVLLAHNADQDLPIASVTKLFTAAALDAVPHDEEVVITAADVATEGRAGKLEAGQSYSVRELMFPLLLESSNDAAAALERSIGHITLAGKTLADASGLSSANQASAAVVASQVREVYLTHPHVFDVTKLKQYVGQYTGWVNNSPVRDLPGYQGGKHGYTEAAGKTLAAVFTESALSNRELGYVLLGSKDLKADTIALRESIAHSVRLE